MRSVWRMAYGLWQMLEGGDCHERLAKGRIRRMRCWTHVPYAVTFLLAYLAYAVAGSAGEAPGKAPTPPKRVPTPYESSGHGSPERGIRRLSNLPRGSCLQCHSTKDKGGGYPKGLFARNDQTLCYACHQTPSTSYPAQESDRDASGYFIRGRWPGASVYEDLRYSVHRASNAVIYPGKKTYAAGDCKNCHNPHGSRNPYDQLVSRYIGGGPSSGNFQLCFDCHGGPRGPTGMSSEGRRILSYYSLPLVKEAAPGHQITRSSKQRNDFAQAKLKLGDKLPCYDCHNVHGSQGSDRTRPNGRLISDQRAAFWYGLTNTLTDPAQNRRFCFGCHVESDGVPFSREVEGIKMNRISDLPEHRLSGTGSCYSCHASVRPYESDTSFNVHYVKFAP
jgi:hypothetical protein